MHPEDDQNLSNYPRASSVKNFEVNSKILTGAVKAGVWLVALYVLLTIAGFVNGRLAWDQSAINRGLGIGIAKTVVFVVLGFFVCHWFDEAYRAVCGLRGLAPRFRTKQIIGLCANPFLGMLALAYFSDWVWAKTESSGAPTMTWKSLWSRYPSVNMFAVPLAIYDGILVSQYLLPYVVGRPSSPMVMHAEMALFPVVLITGHILGSRLTQRILTLAG